VAHEGGAAALIGESRRAADLPNPGAHQTNRRTVMRILLADDHDLVRETMAAFLMSEGQAEVDTVGTLHEGLDLETEKGAYDLVLLTTTCRE
jgi:response regulator RpfG family c-di-GMP phosphodiesterase